MPAPAEVQKATLENFIEGWKGWTPDGFLDSWSEDCTQTTLPFSSGQAVRTREHTEKLFPKLMSLLTDMQVTIHNVIHDPSQGKAVIYAITKAHTPFMPYRNEHACFVWFNETGDKVNKIEEMFDAVFMQDFLPKLDQYLAQQGQAGGTDVQFNRVQTQAQTT